VWADQYAGGLLGYNTGAVTNCYSTSAVWAWNYSYFGGLVGDGTSSAVKNSFWDTEISGLQTSYGGTGRDTAALQTQATFTDAGWDFVGETANGSGDIWRLCNESSEYPKLAWQYLPGDFLCPDYVDFLDFAQLGRWWLDPDTCAADLTGDGIINAQDLIVESYNWLMGMAPGWPGNPDPPNFAKQAPWYADLAWTPALFAQSYDVYFGTSAPPPFVANQTATMFWPGMMEYQTSYYWRIDPVNTWGTTVGPLWIFTTASPAQATNPYPFDDQMGAGTGTGLRWDAGSGAVSHDIYFGTANPPPFLRSQTGTSFYQSELTYRTRYYWRIDEVGAGGTTTGVVWSFTTIFVTGRCFPADTVVWVDGGLVPIIDVVPGQKVGRADGSAEVEWIQEHGVGAYDCYDVVFESGNSIVVVDSHKFLTLSGEWVAVENLSGISKLQSLNGPIGVSSVVKRAMPFVGNAYNLKIKGANVFFVGKDGVAAVDCSKLPGE
jgi:hypothetical protein